LNLFSKRFIDRHQTKLLVFVVWLHVSILDFLYVSYRGPVFLFKESLQVNTLLTHGFIALLTLAFSLLVARFFARKNGEQSQSSIAIDARLNAKVTEE
jgi:hypothetical protein